MRDIDQGPFEIVVNKVYTHMQWLYLFELAGTKERRLIVSKRWLEHCLEKHGDKHNLNAEVSVPYHIGFWSHLFHAATSREKPAIATRWLENYLQHIQDAGLSTTCLHGHIATHNRLMRSMILTIPANSDVLRPRTDARGRVTIIKASDWMRNFVDIRNPLLEAAPGADSPHLTLLRDVWLKPRQSDRLEALHRMASIERTMRYNLSNRCVRAVIWAAVQKNGLRDADVVPATRLTLLYYDRAQEERLTDGSQTDIALGVVMAHADAGMQAGPYNMSFTKARALLRGQPTVSAELLRSLLIRPRRHGDTVICKPGDNSISQGLAKWLPGHEAAVMCAEQLGMEPLEIIEQVLQNLRQKDNLELPIDIGGDLAP